MLGIGISMGIGSGGYAFTPLPLVGTGFWLDARNGLFKDTAGTTPATANGDVVKLIKDQSPNNHNLTWILGNTHLKLNRFANSLPCVAFDADAEMDVAGINLAQTGTFVMAFENYTCYSTNTLISWPISPFWWNVSQAGYTFQDPGGAMFNTSNVSGSRGSQVLSFAWDGTSSVFRHNGIEGTFRAFNLFGPNQNPIRVGAYGSGNTGYNGQFGLRQLFFNPNKLSDANVIAIENYMNSGVSYLTPFPASDGNLILFEGDSMTAGTGTSDGVQNYPGQTIGLLTNRPQWGNDGINGQTAASMRTLAPTSIDPYYNAGHGTNVVVLMGGTNDINNGVSAATTYTSITGYGADRKAVGWKVIVLTVLPRTSNTGPEETQRQSLNTLLKADNVTVAGTQVLSGATWCDYLVTIDAETNLQDPSNATYFADGTHLTPAGYAIVAADVKTALNLLGLT